MAEGEFGSLLADAVALLGKLVVGTVVSAAVVVVTPEPLGGVLVDLDLDDVLLGSARVGPLAADVGALVTFHETGALFDGTAVASVDVPAAGVALVQVVVGATFAIAFAKLSAANNVAVLEVFVAEGAGGLRDGLEPALDTSNLVRAVGPAGFLVVDSLGLGVAEVDDTIEALGKVAVAGATAGEVRAV